MESQTSPDSRLFGRRMFLRRSVLTAATIAGTATTGIAVAGQASGSTGTIISEDASIGHDLPLLVPGLVRWYRADAITGLADGSFVDSWLDSTGGGASLTPVGGGRPTWHSNAYQGLPGVRFNRLDANRMASQRFASPPVATTYFVAFRPESESYNVDSVVVDGVSGRHSLYLTSGRQPSAYAGRAITDKAFVLDPNDVSPMVLAGIFAGTKSVMRYMGQPLVTGNAGIQSLGSVVVGGMHSGSSPFEGDVYEVLVYNRNLTPADCRLVEAYLGSKWAMTGMRMEQPFEHDTFEDELPPHWTTHAEGAVIGLAAGRVQLDLPQGPHGSPTEPASPAPRIEQAVSDGPFDVAVQWDSVPANWGNGDGHGILARGKAGRVVRLLNAHHSTSAYQERVRLQTQSGADSQTVAETSKRAASPWLRLRRHGNYWTAYRSPNGSAWYRVAPAAYIPAVEVEGIALTALNGGSVAPAYTALLAQTKDAGGAELVDLRDQIPSLIVGRTWRADNFSVGVPSWLDDVSQVGGAATVEGDRLRLSVSSTNKSRGAVMFNAADLQDCVLLTRITYVGSGYQTWIVPTILGQGRANADQYRPLSTGWAMELTDQTTNNTAAKLVRMHDSSSSNDQGPYDFPEPNVKALRPSVATFWMRLERRGQRIRSRMWADGSVEPATWLWDLQDDTIPGPGRPSLVYAFNNGIRPVGAHVYVDALVIEELLHNE